MNLGPNGELPEYGGLLRDDGKQINRANVEVSEGGSEWQWTPTATAAPIIDRSTPCVEVLIQCDPDCSGTSLVGLTSSPVTKLKPSATFIMPIDDAVKIYTKISSGAPVLNVIARL